MTTAGQASPENGTDTKRLQTSERAALFQISARARKFAGHLLLRSPATLRSLRRVPLLGNMLHRLSHRFVPLGEYVWSQVRQGPARGLWLELNPRTGQGYWLGQGEPGVQKVLAERLRPGMVFYDLGANIGFFTLLAARLVGPQGKVFSFEPDPEAFTRLKRNIEKNGFAQVTAVNAGVSSNTGPASFLASDPASPDRGLGKLVQPEAQGAGTVPCVALDDFIANAPAPDAIKCDVEGAEVEVFRGARKLCTTRRPAILCETHSPECSRSVESLLAEYGYRLQSLDENHLLALP